MLFIWKAKFKINNLRFHFKRLEIKEEIKLKEDIKEEVITARRNRIKNRNVWEKKKSVSKSQFLKNAKGIDEPLVRLTK